MMNAFKQITWIGMSLLSVGIATHVRADFVIPTLGQIQDRQAAINYCKGYASNAVQQFAKSQALGCGGFSGPRWNNDYQGQYNWCLTVLEPFALNEEGIRSDALKACQEKQGSGSNPQNQVPVPQVCKDPSKAYTAVRQINHHFRYETTVTSPVQNGLISYDYNRDKKPDYVFLETREDQSRVAMCFSQGQGYRRQLTDIKFYSGAGGLGSSNYEISQQGDLLVVRIDEFEHNAGSSYLKVSYRFDTAIAKFRMVDSSGDDSPVIYDGEPYPMALPMMPRLF